MTTRLPSAASLEQLRNQAKDILRAHREGDSSCCRVLRHLRQFQEIPEARILATEVGLQQVQFALAMDYGFPTWAALKEHVEAQGKAGSNPGDDPDTRLVLTGVPKIGYHRRLCPFPGSVEAALEFLGTPEPYDFLMGVSGAPFRRIWNPSDGGNVDINYLHPEPHRLLFQAIGRSYQVLPATDRPALLAAVKQSIAEGIPVLGFGIVGPPEAGLVCGYEQGGDVLLGHSYFDFEKRPAEAPYYAKEGWFEQMVGTEPSHGEPRPVGMIVLGGRQPRPAPLETLRESLRWAIDLERTTHRANLPNHICGLAAYDAWADALEVDADYSPDAPALDYAQDDPTAARSWLEVRAMVHGDQATMLMERREAAAFLRRMAECAGAAASPLREAAELYDQIGRIVVWPWRSYHYMADEVKEGLADGALRRRIAALVRQAAALEARAVAKLEAAADLLARTTV
ncbi:MAG: hypothetical protein RBU25_05015 [Lentisphaeria bacterium]|jgi:hypothetical protein|nr:hypothetical protein [Lentisphaeria bacterium]